MAKAFGLFLSLALGATAVAQDPNAVSQRDIDQAIRKGSEFLKTTAVSSADWLHPNCDELILLTLIHAGVPEANPRFEEYLRHCLQAPLEKTYKVALLAMCLEELDASGYQMKIAQCAAFLLDNQAANGQWSYGKPVDVKNYPFVEREKKVETGARPAGAREFGPAVREHKKPSKSIAVPQTKHEGEAGDNSNSQYASLGLRACFDANIKLPAEALHLARKWWVESQWPDEGDGAKAGKNAVNSGGETTRIQGWSYKKSGDEGQKAPYHAMTAGAVGATVIYEYMLGRDFKKDAVTKAGVNWLAKNYAINDNLYYMYALERAGMLYDTAKFGDHDWYWDGAKHLVKTQKDDGSWGNNDKPEKNTWDTCFAILFLKKATRGVVSVDRR
ncbi:MAG TPA: hypothetical protein VE981_09030 [Planctomycetota bacterium]|nr:hypothetical protein [Planctomycetota bacterium]